MEINGRYIKGNVFKYQGATKVSYMSRVFYDGQATSKSFATREEAEKYLIDLFEAHGSLLPRGMARMRETRPDYSNTPTAILQRAFEAGLSQKR